MGIIQDRRPRDWTYAVAFDRKDYPFLLDMSSHIRKTHDADMIEYLNNQFENKNQTITIGNKELKTKSIVKTEDLVVDMGLQQCIRIIQGTSSSRFTQIQIAHGSGGSPPNTSNTSLDNSGGGPFTLTIATNGGWAEAKGMKLFFGVIVPQDPVGPISGFSTASEVGVFSASSDLLNRESFFNNKLVRSLVGAITMYNAVIMISSVIEFCPIAD